MLALELALNRAQSAGRDCIEEQEGLRLEDDRLFHLGDVCVRHAEPFSAQLDEGEVVAALEGAPVLDDGVERQRGLADRGGGRTRQLREVLDGLAGDARERREVELLEVAPSLRLCWV